nr:hypothetical protein [Neobacillus sp. Marseille-Q6967]
MWRKSKVLLFSLCFQMLLFSFFTLGGVARAEKTDTEGFIIEADRVVGSGVTAGIVSQETSANNGKPMLRFHYESATIYGMKLTKQVKNQKGNVGITLQAKGPVTVKDMTVDVTEISFKGACVKAGETIPELGMENVVMVAHYMNSTDSVIKNLLLNTVNGDTGTTKPGKLKLLEDLSKLPLDQLEKEIGRITRGHLPLTCEAGDATAGKGSDPVKDVIEVVTDPLEPVADQLEPVLDPLEPVLDPLDPVLKPVEPILKPLNPVLKPVQPILKPLDPVLKPVEPILKPLDPVLKPVEPILEPLEPITDPLDPVVGGAVEVVKTTCEKLSDAKGVITKELVLELVEEAIEKKVSLSSICQGDAGLIAALAEWEEGLLKSLGLVNLFGKLIPTDPLEQLYKIRSYLEKQANGAIVFKY